MITQTIANLNADTGSTIALALTAGLLPLRLLGIWSRKMLTSVNPF